MPSIVIRIRPGDLTEPDLDIRYKIPDLLKERSKGLLVDYGYDFEIKTDAIQIFLFAHAKNAQCLPMYLLSVST